MTNPYNAGVGGSMWKWIKKNKDDAVITTPVVQEIHNAYITYGPSYVPNKETAVISFATTTDKKNWLRDEAKRRNITVTQLLDEMISKAQMRDGGDVNDLIEFIFS